MCRRGLQLAGKLVARAEEMPMVSAELVVEHQQREKVEQAVQQMPGVRQG